MRNMVQVVCLVVSSLVLALAPALVNAQPVNVHSFVAEDIDGNPVNLADYRGQALLIVNTASRCGYTRQYKPLEELYQRYKDRGFVVLAFPANNFGGQEPGSDAEIKNFCYLTYQTTFPLFAKSSVKGGDISALYKYLTEDSPFPGPISWNFNKFLVDPNGEVVARFDSPVDPLADEVIQAVEQVLPQRP